MNKAKLTFKQISSRITGLSFPFFGVSWQPEESDIKIATRVISFLEDRRVLYSPGEMEMPRHCVTSIFEIRKMLTDEIGKISPKKDLHNDLQLLRAACRKFLDEVQPYESDLDKYRGGASFSNWVFFGALGELRGAFGIYLSKIAVGYGLNIAGELSKIIPVTDDGEHLENYH